MHKTAMTVLLPLILVLAACSPGSQTDESTSPDSASAQQQAPANMITGTVSLQPGVTGAHSVSPNARLELILEDTSQQPAVPIATKTIDPVGQLPVKFELEFNPDRVVPDDVLIIVAKLTDGERHYTMPLQYPVLTHNAPRTAEIQLAPEPTPAEKMMAAYRNLQGQLGAMRISKGTSLGDKGSSAWQIFKKNGHVQFIVEIEDNFETNARIRTDYAYEDGRTWVVIRKHMPKAGAKPDDLKRAGWDKDGKLVLKEHVVNGKTGTLSEKDAQELRKDAQQQFKRAGGK